MDNSSNCCSEDLKKDLDEAIENFYRLWSQRDDLKRQIEMEKDLGDILNKTKYEEKKFDFNDVIEHQLENILKNGPLFHQVKRLKKNDEEKNEMKNQQSIEEIKHENDRLENEINIVLDKIVSFNDPELHELRLKKQQLELDQAHS